LVDGSIVPAHNARVTRKAERCRANKRGSEPGSRKFLSDGEKIICDRVPPPAQYMERLKDILNVIWLPLFALAAVAMFYAVWILLELPPRDEVVEISRHYFETYGLIIILLAAIIEGALFVGWYFPGSLVIVVGVVLAGKNLDQLLGVYLATTIGFWVAFVFNFYVGKYGWYKLLTALGFSEALEKAQRQLMKYGPRAIFFTNFHPNLGALTATAAGILQMRFATFALYMVAATLLWNIFWTIVGYSFGEYAIELVGPKFVLPFIAIWITVVLVRKWWHQRSAEPIEDASQV